MAGSPKLLRLDEQPPSITAHTASAATSVLLVARLDFAYRAPSLHVALETTAAIGASAAAFLLLGRFRRTGFLEELLLSAGFSLFRGRISVAAGAARFLPGGRLMNVELRYCSV